MYLGMVQLQETQWIVVDDVCEAVTIASSLIIALPPTQPTLLLLTQPPLLSLQSSQPIHSVYWQ